ncbi:prolyl oligopeptidase family protein [Corynebacterium kutscheri]|uniref:prolyl oligopeptidase family protein n=1 Tax=Corynebacterium kutscheri TaxID=35755 RepID=UPI0037BFC49A
MLTFMDLLRIDDPAACQWAKKWSQKTQQFCDPTLQQRFLDQLNRDDRITYVTRRGKWLYNFWCDAKNPRGLWRRTTDMCTWEVLIDVDKLAKEEGENWVWKGAHVRFPEADLALVRLSRGGSDAVVIREFDIEARIFTDDFYVPEAKSEISWIDADTVLISTDFGQGSLTNSGYPARSHLWRRGQKLADSEEFFSGHADDLMISAWADTDPGFQRLFAHRQIDFYSQRTFLHTPQGLQIIEVAQDCSISVFRHWLFLLPRSEFLGIPAGGIGVCNFDEFLAGNRTVHVLFTPTPTSSVQTLDFTNSRVLVTILDNVSSHIIAYDLETFTPCPIELPPLVTARVVATDRFSEEVFIATSSFTQPETLYRNGEIVASAPQLFRTNGLETRQYWARSADGTRIPYFITGRFDGPHKALVYAYGGFEISLVPQYSGLLGPWLEAGNYYVQANLRGGGEFGPSWHEQAIKNNRVVCYEDHYAVICDLVERGFSTPEQIAIRGGSNGGLLTAVALTRYPEAFGAAVIQVPLTDMMRYHTLLAGASWIAEYGDPEGAEKETLLSYSPLHNISERQYPPALITTSTRDDRVHPAHARLFAQALQEAGKRVDYYENTEGGHAGAANNEQIAFMNALVYGWLNTMLE